MTEERSALPPLAANEVSTLQAFLELHRGTLRRKASGLTRDQLAQALPPSTMTLGGLLKHARLDEPEALLALFDDAVARSRRVVLHALDVLTRDVEYGLRRVGVT